MRAVEQSKHVVVNAGDIIGTRQALVDRYVNITEHVHIAVSRHGKSISFAGLVNLHEPTIDNPDKR